MLTKLNKPKKLSSRSGAFIGAEASSDLRIAVRFSQAFKVLYNSDKYQDEIVMPALFLVRQFLELGLKYNIRQLAPHSKSQNLINKLSKMHDLTKLYVSFSEHYKFAKRSLELTELEDDTYLADLKSLVDEINKFDNKSTGYRYSTDKDGTLQIDENATFNLSPIGALLDNVVNFLAHIEDILYCPYLSRQLSPFSSLIQKKPH